jgi:hypothetical protein
MFRTVTLPIIRSLSLPKTCRVLCINKFETLWHVVDFIENKYITLFTHLNVKIFLCVRNKKPAIMTLKKLGIRVQNFIGWATGCLAENIRPPLVVS